MRSARPLAFAALAVLAVSPVPAEACVSGPVVVAGFEWLAASGLSLLLLAAACWAPERPERNLARFSSRALRSASAALQASLLVPLAALLWPPGFGAALVAAPLLAGAYALWRLPSAPCLVVTLGAWWPGVPALVAGAAAFATLFLGWRWGGMVWLAAAALAAASSAGLLVAAELRHAAEPICCRTFEA